MCFNYITPLEFHNISKQETEIIDIPDGKHVHDLWVKENIDAKKQAVIKMMPHTLGMIKI
ncbi:MAG: hypothetical protein JXQ23_07955 [Clostridia bacterium]|nr:hypothetical protein [Clostridia bacterium]